MAGVLRVQGQVVFFNYGRSYLDRPDRIPIYLPELPLRPGRIRPPAGLPVAGCIRDAGPDAWGQRVILRRRIGTLPASADTGDFSLLTYLLESGSNRVGALDFQLSPTEFMPRTGDATLEQMQTAAEMFLAGQLLEPALQEALLHGTSVGGARPKVLLHEEGPGQPPREVIAKLSVLSDPYPVVRAEAVAMDLARRAGLDVAGSHLIESSGRDVLLVDRFDRPGAAGSVAGNAGERRLVVSALTMLGLDEMHGRYATYHGLADLVRQRFTHSDATLGELFRRVVFNICVSNTDDHARNHAAFWDGVELTLTPAYDLSPQMRSGDTAEQAMAIGRNGQRASRLAVCVDAADVFHLDRTQAKQIIDELVSLIEQDWEDAADAARQTEADRSLLWHRLVLNPAIHYLD